MKEIKRLDVSDLSEKFGLEREVASFIFKPQEITPQRQHEPHRSEMYSLGLVVKGEARLRVDLESYHVQAPGLVAVGPDQVRQWMIKDENIQFVGLFFTEDFVVSGLSDTLFLKKLPFFKMGGYHFVSLKPAELASIKTLLGQIEEKVNSNLPNKLQSIQALLRALLLEVESLPEIRTREDSGKYLRAHYLTEKFKELLAAHFTGQREVSYYAEKLFVTPKHLSQTLKEQTGKTATELINEFVCLEAKVLLQRKDLNISKISDQLNFANPSFFGKFFKRNTQISPQQYRKSLS